MNAGAHRLAFIALVAVGCTPEAQVASEYLKTQFIAAAQGGTLAVNPQDSTALAGTAVMVPAHALPSDATLTVALGPANIAPAGTQGIGPVADLGPSGTVFDSLVTVTIPYDRSQATNQDHIFVAGRESGGTQFRIERANLQITPSTGTVSFPVRGLTEFQVALDGVCGHCPTGSTCDTTSAQCVCDTDLTSCSASGKCVDLRFDNNNCGTCGNACGALQCVDGGCH